MSCSGAVECEQEEEDRNEIDVSSVEQQLQVLLSVLVVQQEKHYDVDCENHNAYFQSLFNLVRLEVAKLGFESTVSDRQIYKVDFA